jgi:RPA family protein
MLRLEVNEKWRVETQEEAEQFIKAAREAGNKDGYELTKASYAHKEKTAKGEVIDACEIVSLTKVYNGIWNI